MNLNSARATFWSQMPMKKIKTLLMSLEGFLVMTNPKLHFLHQVLERSQRERQQKITKNFKAKLLVNTAVTINFEAHFLKHL